VSVKKTCVDFEYVLRAHGARGQHALAAEVVIALDHDIRPHADGKGSDRARAQQTKLRTIGWCADRVPVDPRIEMPGLAARRHVNLVAERRETLGDRLHVQAAARVEHVSADGTPISNIPTSVDFTPVSGSIG